LRKKAMIPDAGRMPYHSEDELLVEDAPRPRATFFRDLLGAAALSCAIVGCAWSVYASLGDPSVDPALEPQLLASAPSDADDADDDGDPDLSAALFDPGYSRFRAGTFAQSATLPPRFGSPKAERTNAENPSLARLGEDPGSARSVPFPAPRPAALPKGPLNQAQVAALASKAMASAAATEGSWYEKLFGRIKEVGTKLAYATPDGGLSPEDSVLSKESVLSNAPRLGDKLTAVYDISARKVYMPDGTELEAHSGLGEKMDDPRYAHVRMHGPTPPHVYDLKERESLFHGVRAIRLVPLGGNPYGRTGLLAHTYLLGPRGDSNGCVSFKNYDAFLQAYLKGKVERLIVVASRN
jgi:hypothetical protein